MSWLYFFEDNPEQRMAIYRWLKDELSLRTDARASLPKFPEWLSSYSDEYPDLLVLDLYKGNDPERTVTFIRQLRANPRTCHLPVVLLTIASMQAEGRRAFAELEIHDFIPKAEYLRPLDDGTGWEVRQDLSSALRERLLLQIARGAELRHTMAVKDRLRRLMHGRSFAIFEAQPPFRLLDGSPDVLAYLKEHLKTGPDSPAPEALRPMLLAGGLTVLRLPDVKQRRLAVRIDPDKDGSLLLSFRDLCSLPYLQAIQRVAFQRFLVPDHRQKIRQALEATYARLPGQFSEERLGRIIDGAMGNFFALAGLNHQKLKSKSSKDLRDLARARQGRHFKAFAAGYRFAQLDRDLAAVHGVLNADSMHLSDAWKMAAEMKKILHTYPLVESTL